MLVGPELAALRVGLLVAIALAGVVAARLISARLSWGAAGPLALMAATPFVPSLPVAAGVSTDDVLPVLGAVLCVAAVGWRALPRVGWPKLLVVGAALMALAGIVSSLVNATGPQSALSLLLRGAGHIALLGVVGAAVAASTPSDRRRLFVARALAVVGTAEGMFGLVAWIIPLPGQAGLEAARTMTSLLDRVPGRIAGTTGLSPNFLGAVFVLSIPLTAALALRAADRRAQWAWWGATAVQLAALALTFTRTSLVIVIGIMAVMLLARGHARWLLAMAALVVVIAIATPLGARMLGDANDRAALWSSGVLMMIDHPVAGVGPGRMLEVARADPARYQDTTFGRATSNAHNTVLLAGAETGVAGAIGALLVNLSIAGLALAAVLNGVRRPRPGQAASANDMRDVCAAAGLGVLGFLVQGMTNNLFAVQVTSVTGMLVLGAFLVPASTSLVDVVRRLRAPVGPVGSVAA